MRILLLGEYSNVHNTLARGLRALGHEVTVASNGDFWKDYPRDIDLARSLTHRGTLSFLWRLMKALPDMRGYDIVQLINPMFLEIKAERLFAVYDYLRRNNGRIIMGAFGMDYYWMHVNDTLRPLRYSDSNIGDTLRHDDMTEALRRDVIGTAKQRLNEHIARDCDAIVAGLYEYWATYREADNGQLGEKLTFIPFPVECCQTEPSSMDVKGFAATPSEFTNKESEFENQPTPQPLRIFCGISRKRHAYKGTDIMLRAAQDVQAKYPERVELTVAEGVPFAQYQHMMDTSDCILDQLYAYTPAMNALLAMSKGIIVIGGGEPENYDILGEKDLRPIVNVQPTYESCYTELERLVLHPELIPVLKQQSVEYIRRHHDYMKVAKKYEELYTKLMV